MMHSALSIRSCGISSGMSMTSLSTIPQFSSRSVSFLSLAAESGRATRANAIRQDSICLITIYLDVVSGLEHHRVPAGWVQPWALELVLMRGFASKSKTPCAWITLPFDYTFPDGHGRAANEHRKNGTAMGGGHPAERDGCVHERHRAAGRAIKS